MNVRALACAAAFVSLAPAFAVPAVAQQTQSNAALPAPIVLRIPTTYGGHGAAASTLPLAQPNQQLRAQLQAQRYAAAMAFIRKYGPGTTVRLKTVSARYR